MAPNTPPPDHQEQQGIPIPIASAAAQSTVTRKNPPFGGASRNYAQPRPAASGSPLTTTGTHAPPNSLVYGAGQGTPLNLFNFGPREIIPGTGAPPNSYAAQSLAPPHAAPGISGSVIYQKLAGIGAVKESTDEDEDAMCQSPSDSAMPGISGPSTSRKDANDDDDAMGQSPSDNTAPGGVFYME
ncbi:hypothetical protein LPJ61_000509 [Coemansia biformis]|uniref:Uncharacterized protein n=1 Tax=Coemansia biformis TaxID=1286918 RepID=A0A9W8CY41_9FUNG|nr:hypothetical protein LPJ61_000509 [Coemansia biformis]